MSSTKKKRSLQEFEAHNDPPQASLSSFNRNRSFSSDGGGTTAGRKIIKATMPSPGKFAAVGSSGGDSIMGGDDNLLSPGSTGSTNLVTLRKAKREKLYLIEMRELNHAFKLRMLEIENIMTTDFASDAYCNESNEKKAQFDSKHCQLIATVTEAYQEYSRKISERYTAPPVGFIMTFGSGDCGQIGLSEDLMSSAYPRNIPSLRNRSIASLGLGGLHTAVAMDDSGEVETWGCNDEGSLGDYLKDTAFTPGKIHGFIPSKHEVAGDRLQEMITWSDLPPDISVKAKNPSYKVVLKNGKTVDETIVALAAGNCQTLALSDTGRVYMFGAYKDVEGKPWRDCMPPDDPRTVHPVEKERGLVPPTGKQDWPIHVYQIPGKAVMINCGASFNAAIVEANDGEGRRECVTWGLGESGELARPVFKPLKKPPPPEDEQNKKNDKDEGPYASYHVDKARDEYMVPKPVIWEDTSILTNRTVESIGCGEFHLMVIARDGAGGALNVFSSGLNNYGQLGLGDERNREKLTRITALDGCNITSVEGGVHHSLCIDAPGRNLYAWGRSCSGQMGNTSESPAPGSFENLPISVSLNENQENPVITQISCGGNHNLVLTEDGEAYTWGYGDMGALGHGEEKDENRPRKLDALKQMNKSRASKNKPLLQANILKVVGGGQHSAITLTTK